MRTEDKIEEGKWSAEFKINAGETYVIYRKKGSDQSLTSEAYDSKASARRAARVILKKLAAVSLLIKFKR